jgi:hypothetical protein
MSQEGRGSFFERTRKGQLTCGIAAFFEEKQLLSDNAAIYSPKYKGKSRPTITVASLGGTAFAHLKRAYLFCHRKNTEKSGERVCIIK